MKRTNLLIFCRNCKANRAMKAYKCLQCGAQHVIESDGKVELEEKKDKK